MAKYYGDIAKSAKGAWRDRRRRRGGGDARARGWIEGGLGGRARGRRRARGGGRRRTDDAIDRARADLLTGGFNYDTKVSVDTKAAGTVREARKREARRRRRDARRAADDGRRRREGVRARGRALERGAREGGRWGYILRRRAARAREVRGTDFRNGCVFRRRRACPPPSFKRARR